MKFGHSDIYEPPLFWSMKKHSPGRLCFLCSQRLLDLLELPFDELDYFFGFGSFEIIIIQIVT